uniref:Uncharacterized protein n=1 Tax=Picea glauca TaxID=3330 RepID=A0A101LWJ1_PICGL|nr:hypothetical protein ABT39_MTgene1316 [Picea glauca]
MKKRLMEGSPGRKEAGTWKETSRIRNEQMLAHSKDVYYPARTTIGSIEPLGTTPSKANNELR